MTSAVLPRSTAPSAGASIACLVLILALSLTIELHELGRRGFVVDEVWTMEVATGRGSSHQGLPADRVLPAPDYSRLAGAPPWWRVWSHVEITHPPLYLVLLRGWMGLVGDSDLSGRLFSVAGSAASIALLFEIVRRQVGLGGAAWAGLLMALSAPQVEYARICRGYTLLTAVALGAALVAIAIQQHGMTRGRWWALTGAVLATLLTHYFSLGTLAALGVWAVLARPDLRRPLVAAWATAGAAFAVVWGPFMWRQRHLFATDDPNTLFLTGADPHHAWTTLQRVVVAPMTMLWPPTSNLAAAAGAVLGVALFVLPLVPAVRRRTPSVSLWWLWVWGTLAVVAALDVARGTNHLFYHRYMLLAGPGVYALVACLGTSVRRRSVARAAALVTVAACAAGLPGALAPGFTDPRAVLAALPVVPGRADLLVFAAPPADRVASQLQCLHVARYLPVPGTPLALLTRPAGPDVVAAARRSRVVVLFTPAADYRAYLPPARVVRFAAYDGLGNVWTLRYDDPRPADSRPADPRPAGPTAGPTDGHPAR